MRKIMLNGRWELAEAGKDTLCAVQVPGSVLSGLYGAGKIEDPFYRTNEDATRELFWKDYEFCRTFAVTEDVLNEKKVILVCEGLDTLADIYINGKKAGSTDNMHRTWKLDVKGFLHSGENQIRIVFRSVFKYIEDYEYEENKEIHYVPCGGMKGNQLIRKAHCMFGWDWGPQTIDAGIFRDIYLEAYSHPRIEDVKITQRHGDNAVDVCTTVAVSGDAVDKCQVRVSIRKDMTSVCGNGHAVQETGDLEIYADGAVLLNSNSVTLTGRIHNPKLWWPNGYGDQPLYKVQVELLDEYGTVLETITKRIGLRTLTISQEKDLWGKEFAFCVNGVKIFARSPMGRGYTLADAYDIKQTQGRDISRITLQNDSKEMEAALTTVLNYAVVPVVIDKELPAPAFYDSANLELAINPDYPDNEAFAAITAEVAHSRFHAKGANASYDRGECELDAQSISYILCRRYGIERPMPDMSNLAALYEGWEPQECRQALDNIQDTSKQFGRSIEKNLEMGKQRSRAPVHRPTR